MFNFYVVLITYFNWCRVILACDSFGQVEISCKGESRLKLLAFLASSFCSKVMRHRGDEIKIIRHW